MSGRWWTWLLMFPWVLQPIWLLIRQHLERRCIPMHNLCVFTSSAYVFNLCIQQSQLLGAFRQSSENIPRMYLHYRMCKFLTWRQVDKCGSFDKINGHCYLTVIKALFNINNQSTLCVISFWLSEALLPWVATIFFSCIYIWGMKKQFSKLWPKAPRSWDCIFRGHMCIKIKRVTNNIICILIIISALFSIKWENILFLEFHVHQSNYRSIVKL